MENRYFAIQIVTKHLGFKVVARILLSPEVDRYLLIAPARSGGQALGPRGICYRQVATIIFYNPGKECPRPGEGEFERLARGETAGGLDPQFVFRLIELYSLSKVEEMVEELEGFRCVLPLLRAESNKGCSDTAIQGANRPEEGGRIAETVFHGYSPHEVGLFEGKAGLFALDVELNPGKAEASGALNKDKEEDDYD